jgi:chromosomal replication initiation ATPase DnaA
MNTIETLRKTIASLQALLAQAILTSQQGTPQDIRPNITAEFIFIFVAREMGVSQADILSRSRLHRIFWARSVITYLINYYSPDTSLSEIGRMIDRDHGTVIHAISVVETQIAIDKRRAAQVAALKTKIETALHHPGQSGQSSPSIA